MAKTDDELRAVIAELNATIEQLEAQCWRLKADFIEMQRAWEQICRDFEALEEPRRGEDG